MIQVTDITQTYSGKPGCMCGCRGKYNNNPKSFKAALTRMLKTNYKVVLWDPVLSTDEDGGYLVFETESRTNAIYFKIGALSSDTVPKEKLWF